MTKKGNLVVISGPSGTGKDTVVNQLLKRRPELLFSVSATTRAPRPGEKDGVDYMFLSRESFLEKIDKGLFLEYAEYIGYFYGTPAEPIRNCVDSGNTMILVIEVQGAKQIMEKVPDAITIFIMAPSMEELERRLRGRGTDSEEKLKARLERANKEFKEAFRYKYTVVNDEVPRAVDEIINILEGHL